MCIKKNKATFYALILLLLSYVCYSQNTPPSLTATGNQVYCSSNEMNIVTDFNIIDPDDTAIEALYIQISTGYVKGEDLISLEGVHPNITTSWNETEGKLILSGIGSSLVSYSDLITATKDIVYQNTGSNSTTVNKTFSITIGAANYLPQTGHYYEFIASEGIYWNDAKTDAESRTYFGLQGYLVTIASMEEALMAGERSTGVGWIGGSDAEEEGVWKWVTGPETGTVFWNGNANGTTPNFAFWKSGEPNNAGNENYAHVIINNNSNIGYWNDLPIDGLNFGGAEGYVIEYGGTSGDPVLNISTSTSITVLPNLPSGIPEELNECDTSIDGDETNGYSEFDLTLNELSILDGANASDFSFLYYTDSDYTNLISDPSSFVNTEKNTQTIYIKVVSNLDANCYKEVNFKINVDTIDIQSSIVFKNCDADGIPDSLTDFNLTEANDVITYNNSDLYTISYYLTLSEANTGTNAVNDMVFNNAIASTLYARVESNLGCFRISEVNLEISTTFFPDNLLQRLPTCDTDTNSIDGYHVFDLSSADGDFTSQFPTIKNLFVTYFRNSYDAQLEGNVIEDINNFTNEFPLSQLIFVRVESYDDGVCFGIGEHLLLKVYPVIPLQEPLDINACDNNLDGDDKNGITMFDLTLNEPEMLNGENASDFNLLYYTDSSYNNLINTPTSFENTSKDSQIIYIKIENNSNTACYSEGTFEINVNRVPDLKSNITLQNCDTDGLADGYTDFNLADADDIIIDGSEEDFTITYHLNLSDANLGTSVITEHFFNNSEANTIYARVEDNLGCYTVVDINFVAFVTKFPKDFKLEVNICDTDQDSMDGYNTFDLNEATTLIVSQFPKEQKTIVKYYESMIDAELGQNEITKTETYTNKTPFEQLLFIRIESEDGKCSSYGKSIKLNVNSIFYPEDPPLDIIECDSMLDGDRTNGFTEFDLTLNESLLLNGEGANYKFSYYTDSNHNDLILNPTSFTNTKQYSQTIYFRIENNLNSKCYNENSFLITVDQIEKVESSIVFKNCDVDNNIDGFTDYNLEEANTIIVKDNSEALDISYHLTISDANLNINAIKMPFFNNAIANVIYARIENSRGCFNTCKVKLQVSTTRFPDNYMKELPLCDDDANPYDGFYTFNLEEKSAEIISQFPSGQNLGITYYTNLNDAHLKQNTITESENYTNETSISQIIFVRVESLDNGDCYGVGPHLQLKVNPAPRFEIEDTNIVCLNKDTPINLSTLNPMDDYTYVWRNDAGEIIGTSTNINVVSSGIYTVTATSMEGCESIPVSFNVVESELASIDNDDITIVELSNNNSIRINNDNNNLGIGDYEFSLNHINGSYQDAPFFNNVPPGTHILYVRDKNGCGVVSFEIFILGFPKYFTPNNDGINDKWVIRGLGDDFSSASTISIFDKYGKLIKQMNAKNGSWDGTFNGQLLSSNDYWFTAELVDNTGNLRVFKGHFSLLR